MSWSWRIGRPAFNRAMIDLFSRARPQTVQAG